MSDMAGDDTRVEQVLQAIRPQDAKTLRGQAWVIKADQLRSRLRELFPEPLTAEEQAKLEQGRALRTQIEEAELQDAALRLRQQELADKLREWREKIAQVKAEVQTECEQLQQHKAQGEKAAEKLMRRCQAARNAVELERQRLAPLQEQHDRLAAELTPLEARLARETTLRELLAREQEHRRLADQVRSLHCGLDCFVLDLLPPTPSAVETLEHSAEAAKLLVRKLSLALDDQPDPTIDEPSDPLASRKRTIRLAQALTDRLQQLSETATQDLAALDDLEQKMHGDGASAADVTEMVLLGERLRQLRQAQRGLMSGLFHLARGS